MQTKDVRRVCERSPVQRSQPPSTGAACLHLASARFLTGARTSPPHYPPRLTRLDFVIRLRGVRLDSAPRASLARGESGREIPRNRAQRESGGGRDLLHSGKAMQHARSTMEDGLDAGGTQASGERFAGAAEH